ncbi:uncharacterized protein V6R79_011028 [Siganus canaliculatus]
MNLRKEDILGIHKDRMKIGASLADVDPMHIDRTVRFDSIGGLSRHISALKEMVVFPLLYPEVFEKFKIQPPRGCLFYGPPGTGKTLVARALANECSQGERKVSFFMRKGADCLSKWVGESERQLRLLFDQAYQMRPSIIFFDEIDGLAPVRSSRQDQIHSSIVSTLLALMDGLDARGEVVVIGATNRLDSIDPALRRPGRFDREFLFGLPDREARQDILKIHTKQWTPPPSDTFLEELAEKCVGYCGADIKAVCSEAALCALRRRYPQIYSSSQKLVLDVNSIAITNKDFMSAMSKMVPASQRAVVSPAKALIPAIRPLLSSTLQDILLTVGRVFPHAELGLKRKKDKDVPCELSEDELMFSEDEEVTENGQLSHSQLRTPAAKEILTLNQNVLSHPTSYRPRLLLEGRPGSGQSSHLAPAVLHALEKFTVYTLDMAVLFGASATAPEETCAQIFVEAKRTSPSVLYIPHISQWWDTVGPALRATFLSLLSSIPAFAPILLLATCSLQYDHLSPEVQELFRVEYGEVFHVKVPTSRERRHFFEDLILNQAAKAPASRKRAVLNALEVLPVAPPPPQRQLTEEETQRLEEQEEDTMRELRLFLRDVTNRLSQDKRFKAFIKPVDLEEVPDYAEVIKKPMDLSTVLSRIDLHQYGTVKEFLQDVDLIWQNALEYNPDRDPSDRQIRHRACALKDTVHAIIRDELDEDFEKICEEIKVSRSKRGCSSVRFAPSYYHVLPKQSKPPAAADVTPQKEPTGFTDAVTPNTSVLSGTGLKNTVQKKKRRRSRWSTGVYAQHKRKYSTSPHTSRDDGQLGSDEEEEDGDDEEEAEKGGGIEVDEGTRAEEEEQTVGDVQPEPAPAQECSSGHTEEAQDSQEKNQETSQAAEDMVIPFETEKMENEKKTQKAEEKVNKAVTDKEGQSGENSPVFSQRSETITVNTNQDSDTKAEGETLRQSSTEEKPTETKTEKCATVLEADDQNKVVSVEEESRAEPMEVEATEGSITAESEAVRGEEDTGTEPSVRRMTRSLKNAVLQQQMMDVDKVLQTLDEKSPPLVVDTDKLKELLERVVTKTDGFEVYKLEKLYALLCQSIYRHRRDYNKTELIQELEQEIEVFC